MTRGNEHRRQDCQYEVGCSGCVNSPPRGMKSKTYDLGQDFDGADETMARRVVDRRRNFMTYHLLVRDGTIIFTRDQIGALRAFLDAVELEDRPYRTCSNVNCWCWMPVTPERREGGTHTPPTSDFESAWADYFTNHPDVVASWGRSNGRMPNCDCRMCQQSKALRQAEVDFKPEALNNITISGPRKGRK